MGIWGGRKHCRCHCSHPCAYVVPTTGDRHRAVPLFPVRRTQSWQLGLPAQFPLEAALHITTTSSATAAQQVVRTGGRRGTPWRRISVSGAGCEVGDERGTERCLSTRRTISPETRERPSYGEHGTLSASCTVAAASHITMLFIVCVSPSCASLMTRRPPWRWTPNHTVHKPFCAPVWPVLFRTRPVPLVPPISLILSASPQ